MPDANIVKLSFNGGEISPRAAGRLDLQQYLAGGSEYENLIPNLVGGLERRQGTQFVRLATGAAGNDSSKFASSGSWLIPFDVSGGSSYVLEFSDYKLRFYRDQGALLYSDAPFAEANINIRAMQFEIPAHGFFHGQKVRLNISEGGTAPTGLVADTVYQVVLAEALIFISGFPGGGITVFVSDTAERSSIAYVDTEMGPYFASAENMNDFPSKEPIWIYQSPFRSGQPEQFQLTTNKDTSSDSDKINQVLIGDKVLIPRPENRSNTFRLCPVQDYDYEHQLRKHSIELDDIGDVGTGSYFSAADTTQEVQLDTPWSYEEAKRLRYTKDGNRMVLFGGEDNFPPYKLDRLGVSAFVLSRLEIEGGPLGPQSPFGKSTKIDLTGIDGDDQAGGGFVGNMPGFHASSSVFTGNDIGRPIRKTYEGDSDGLRQVDAIIERFLPVDGGRCFKITEYIGHSISNDGVFTLNDLENAGTVAEPHPETLIAGELIWISPTRFGVSDFPIELDEATPYYVDSPTAAAIDIKPTIKVSLTSGGVTLSGFTATGSFRVIKGELTSVNPDLPSATVDHGWSDGTDFAGLWFNGLPPLGLSTGRAYKIKQGTDDHFFRLQTLLGEEVPIRSRGSGLFFCSASTKPVNTVRARLIRTVPTLVSFGSIRDATEKWRLGVWNSRDGWPVACNYHEERLLAAGSLTFPMTVWSSEQAVDNSFIPDSRTGSELLPNRDDRTIIDSSGWSFVMNEESSRRIEWITSSTVVLVGSSGQIHQLTGFTPATVQGVLMTSRGASSVRPLSSDAQVIWGSKKHNRIFAAGFDDRRGGYIPEDATILSDHVFTGQNKLIQMVMQEEPWSVVWAIREDGMVYTCTFDQEQGVRAWAKQPIGGTHSKDRIDYKSRVTVADQRAWANVKSIVSIPSTDQRFQEVWMIVERHKPGSTEAKDVYRSIEFLTRRFEIDDRQEDAQFVDCSIPPQNLLEEVSSFNVQNEVLNNRLLDLWIDGGEVAQQTASAIGDVVPDDNPQFKIQAGIPYTFKWVSLSLAAALGENPTAEGIQGVILNAQIFLIHSAGGRIGSPDGDMQDLPYSDIFEDILGEPIGLHTGVLNIENFPDVPSKSQIIQLDGKGPGPFFVSHIILNLAGGVDGR